MQVRQRWTPTYLPQLDGLRSIAVGLVLVYHAVRPASGRTLVPGAFLGVDVFFVLSGFLITSLLLQEHLKEGRIRLLAFYRRRFWRLYPGLVLVAVASVVLLALLQHPDSPDVIEAKATYPRGVLYALTYLMSWGFAYHWDQGALGHTWSLSVEEHFYLVWPLVLMLLLRRPGTRVLRWTIGIAVGAAIWPVLLRVLLDPSRDRIYAGPDTRCGQMMVGVVLAMLLARPQGLARWGFLAAPALTWLAGLGLLVSAAGWHRRGTLYLTGGQSVIAVAAGLVILHLVVSESWLTRLLSQRPFVALGRWSYGIYLWHIPLVIVPAELLGGSLAVKVLAGLTSIPIAAASFRYVESPLLKRYGGRRTAPETAPPLEDKTLSPA
jgi:peptidoglycan/LPS O-acetylase OafA/YrhL